MHRRVMAVLAFLRDESSARLTGPGASSLRSPRVDDEHAARGVPEHEVRDALADAPPRAVRPAVAEHDRLDAVLLGHVAERSAASPASIQVATRTPGNREASAAQVPLGIGRPSGSTASVGRPPAARSSTSSSAPRSRARRAASSTARSAAAEVSVPTRIFFIVVPPSFVVADGRPAARVRDDGASHADFDGVPAPIPAGCSRTRNRRSSPLEPTATDGTMPSMTGRNATRLAWSLGGLDPRHPAGGSNVPDPRSRHAAPEGVIRIPGLGVDRLGGVRGRRRARSPPGSPRTRSDGSSSSRGSGWRCRSSASSTRSTARTTRPAPCRGSSSRRGSSDGSGSRSWRWSRWSSRCSTPTAICSHRAGGRGMVGAVGAAIGTIAFALIPGELESRPGLRNPVGVEGADWLRAVGDISMLLFVFGLLGALASRRHAIPPVERRRTPAAEVARPHPLVPRDDVPDRYPVVDADGGADVARPGRERARHLPSSRSRWRSASRS